MEVPRADLGVVGALAARLRQPDRGLGTADSPFVNLPALRMKFWSRLVMAAAVAFAVAAASAHAASPAPPSRGTYLSANSGDQNAPVAWRSPPTGTPPFTYTLTATPGGYSTTDTSTSRTLNNLTNGTVYT